MRVSPHSSPDTKNSNIRNSRAFRYQGLLDFSVPDELSPSDMN